ncbi:uncharacterized protein LOC129584819 [Paramacrobiotus metropolitanus]|uniref:uncharacterized protein LOC129584819 n=1 Tax=Paramacrobiotus metropolitanus TaxID=2943436 RepID=UPI002445B521|nr:uncharacterized protein LOC129584819 [Paramacrobiotus metropolitanus]
MQWYCVIVFCITCTLAQRPEGDSGAPLDAGMEKRGFRARLPEPPRARELFRKSDSVILRLLFGGGGIAGGMQPGLLKSLRVAGQKRDQLTDADNADVQMFRLDQPEPSEFLGR